MAVDNSRNQILVRGVDYGSPLGHHYFLSHFRDLSIFNYHRTLERALSDGHDRRVLNYRGLAVYRRQRSHRSEYQLFHRFPPGSSVAVPRPAGAASPGLYCLPSTNTISTLVRSSKISPRVTT